jgi:hypothetical protein
MHFDNERSILRHRGDQFHLHFLVGADHRKVLRVLEGVVPEELQAEGHLVRQQAQREPCTFKSYRRSLGEFVDDRRLTFQFISTMCTRQFLNKLK